MDNNLVLKRFFSKAMLHDILTGKENEIFHYEENVDKVLELVPENIGVMMMTKRRALRTVREAESDKSHLDYYTIFKLLRKYEFEDILRKNKIALPEVSQFDYYKECFCVLQEINKESV